MGRPPSKNKYKPLPCYMDDECKKKISEFSQKFKINSMSACVRFLIHYSLGIIEKRIDNGELAEIVKEIPDEYKE